MCRVRAVCRIGDEDADRGVEASREGTKDSSSECIEGVEVFGHAGGIGRLYEMGEQKEAETSGKK